MIDLQSNETTGFHLFFEPRGTLRNELSETIAELAREYGGPVFTPHVTLLARIPGSLSEEEIAEKTRTLVSEFSPFTLTFASLDAKDAYFNALYIQIREREEMERLHATANEIFSMADESPYVPHLSLLYGNYEDGLKQETIRTLSLPREPSFIADRIYLYKTEGEAQNWELVQEFPFGMSNRS